MGDDCALYAIPSDLPAIIMRHMSESPNSGKRLRRRYLIATLAVLLILIAMLGLDLKSRGLAWQLMWSQTGEESPLAQIRGMVEVAGNLVRQPLATEPLAPVKHKSEIPYGINTFLQQEVERPKIEAMLAMIRDAGFVWLRQEFPWEDLEVDGRGQFKDSRQDHDGDGVVDTVDGWAKYDRIVDLTEAYGLRLLVRLSNPPDWSRADPEAGPFAPPDDLQDFVNYAVAIAQRYRGRVSHYQVWNEPNIYPEWGNAFVDPPRYVEMLCRTHAAFKRVDPEIVVVSAAIAPTVSLDGYFGFSDLIFLQEIYDLGGGDCFDVFSAQGYGLFSGPSDRRLRATSVNVARHIYYRDIMVRNGDAHKPIWLSEAAWNATLDAELPRDEIDAFSRYGNVTQEQAAQYMPLLYERAQQEWPWIGNVMYWFFTRKDPFEANQSKYYFRMVEPDYQPEKPSFTPLPVYESVRDYIVNQEPVLHRGRHQAETWQVGSEGTVIADESARYGRAKHFESGIAFRARGTAVEIRWRPAQSDDAVWRVSRFELSANGARSDWIDLGAASVIVDEIAVYDRSLNHLFPLVSAGLALVIVLAGTVAVAVRERLA